jgi:TonB-linked SusC/RagA family outer membrane protein
LYQDSYFKEGVNNFKNYTLRSNVDANITKNLTLTVDLSAQIDRKESGIKDANIWAEILSSPPYLPYYYSNGLPASVPAMGEESNIIEEIRGAGGTTDTRNNILNSKVEIKWDISSIIKGLYVSGTGAYDYGNSASKSFTNSFDYYKYDAVTGTYNNQNKTPDISRSLSESSSNSSGVTLMARIGYNRIFGHHNLSTFIAYEQFESKTNGFSASRSVFLSDKLPYLFAGGAENKGNDGSVSENAYRNIFGRLTYNYKEKYMTEFTLRRDESIKFPEEGRRGYFPGVSAAWRISEEPFISNITFIDELKLKGSWGQMGSDNVSAFQYLTTYQVGTGGEVFVPPGTTAPPSGTPFGDPVSTYPALVSSNVPNTSITWEVTNSSNIGLESSLFNRLLSLQIEAFRSKRSKILTARNATMPSYTGIELPDENIGETLNQGIEISLNHNNPLASGIRYNVGGNFTFVRSKVIFRDESPLIDEWQKQEGYPIDSYLLYLTDGIFNTQQELDATAAVYPGSRVGDIKYIDYNGDGEISGSDMVRIFRSATPEIVFGISMGIEYKGVSLNALLQGQTNADQYINPADFNGNINIPMWMYDGRWTEDNQEGSSMPRAFSNRSETVNKQRSDFWLWDATFIRLKTLELSYTFPVRMLRSMNIQKLRIFANGYNLITLDRMDGMYDPEVNNELGVFYPQTKIYNFGITLSL